MRRFFKEPALQIPFASGFAILLLALFLVVFRIDHGDKFMILHFDAYRGIDLFGSVKVLYNLWTIALLMVLVNYFLASVIYVRDRFLAHVLGLGTLFLSALLLVAISVIILVN